LITREPIVVTVTDIELLSDDESPQVQVNFGHDHCLHADMPFCSVAGSPKHLLGWVSGLEAGRCKLRLSQDSAIPEIGDILVSRDPEAGPIY
jgi:hypothetical protein